MTCVDNVVECITVQRQVYILYVCVHLLSTSLAADNYSFAWRFFCMHTCVCLRVCLNVCALVYD